MSTAMKTEGYNCVEIPQHAARLNEATKKLLKLISERKLGHGGHPMLTWNASCLCTKRDSNDLIRPVKPDRERESSRIDGLSTTIDGLARAIVHEQPVDPYSQGVRLMVV